ncbi:M15 family metallopeptidase [Streptomyces sp. NPDC044571]|uniref:M15 family metallopeptidase n=1 Tax=Streptomyces sp. NPDC044571 TaxID=3155371 RepID=UPI00340AB59D
MALRRLAPAVVTAVGVWCTAALSCAGPVPAGPPPRMPRPELAAEVTVASAAALAATYRPGCPVAPDRLRLIRMNHWGFDGALHRGEILVHEDAVRPLLHVFGEALEAGFPIRRMRPAAAYGGDDRKSMADDNTSAFNCRQVTGDPGRLSRHAYGMAVDINPVENPYVDRHGTAHPSAGRSHLRRDPAGPGMIRPGDAVIRAFEDVGWEWGGRWHPPDYQHFSTDGT